MSLNAFWSALLRRWYLTLGGGIAAVALTALIVVQIGPTYKAEGSVLLFPPTTTLKSAKNIETQGNPYLLLGGLTQARDIVIRTLKSTKNINEFAEQIPDATYDVTPDYTTSGPILVFEVKSRSPEAATTGLQTVMKDVPISLTELQSDLNLSAAAQITSRVVTADAKAQVVRSSQIRTGIVVAAMIGVLTLLLLGLIDGLLAARKRRMRAKALQEAEDRAEAETASTPREEPADPTTVTAGPSARTRDEKSKSSASRTISPDASPDSDADSDADADEPQATASSSAERVSSSAVN